jgi:hypothetical protein
MNTHATLCNSDEINDLAVVSESSNSVTDSATPPQGESLDYMRLLRVVTDAIVSGCDRDETVRRAKDARFLPLDVIATLVGLDEADDRGVPLAGRVCCSRVAPTADNDPFGRTFRRVIYDRFANGKEEFADQEDTEVRWFKFSPTPEQRSAFRKLLLLGWTGPVQLDEVVDLLGEIEHARALRNNAEPPIVPSPDAAGACLI